MSENQTTSEKPSLIARLFTTKVLFWVIALSWAAFDLGTKSWAEDALPVERVYVQDRVPKLEHNFEKYGAEGDDFLPGVLHFKWAENYGAAFSIGADGSVPFTVLSIGVLGIILFYVATTPRKRWFMLLCLALITGGAIGNVYDRFFHKTIDTREFLDVGKENPNFLEERTAVRDFLYWPFEIPLYSTAWLDEGQPPRKWPIFNIADVGIVGGVIGLVAIQLFVPDPKKKKKNEQPPPTTTASA